MHFRKACDYEVDRIMEILADGRTCLGVLGIDQWQGGYPQRAMVESDVARGNSYVVEDEGTIVATAMVSFAGEVDYDHIEKGGWLTPCSSSDARYAVVHRVAVDSACKGQGVAAFLLANALDLAREQGFDSVRIDTHPGNTPMKRLLTKCGFSPCGVIYIAHAAGEATPERLAYERLV